MASSTAKYAIPYIQAADAASQIAAQQQAQAERLDLLLGEGGDFTLAVVAGVVKNQAVVLGRSYPGNATGAHPGAVIITPTTNVGAGASVFYWISAWTGDATHVTGFTISMISSTSTNRSFTWRFLPLL